MIQPQISASDFASLAILDAGGYAEVPAMVGGGPNTYPQLAATRQSLAAAPQENINFAIGAARATAASLPPEE